MEWIILLITIVVVFAAISEWSESSFLYRQKGTLFSPAERSFLGVIDSAVSDKYRIFDKVRVADILSPQKGMNRKN